MTYLFTSAYFAPVLWYVPLAQGQCVCVEQHENFVKQSMRNRCIITGPNGRQTLTVPVEKNPDGKTPIREVRISDHGNWRRLHWNALESSYGKSPFFEYYADDIRPFFTNHWEFLFDYNRAISETICALLQIEQKPMYSSEFFVQTGANNPAMFDECVCDFRPYAEPSLLETLPCKFYYQVFSHKHGFIPQLSILDLLFNLGPESLLYLTQYNLHENRT